MSLVILLNVDMSPLVQWFLNPEKPNQVFKNRQKKKKNPNPCFQKNLYHQENFEKVKVRLYSKGRRKHVLFLLTAHFMTSF